MIIWIIIINIGYVIITGMIVGCKIMIGIIIIGIIILWVIMTMTITTHHINITIATYLYM